MKMLDMQKIKEVDNHLVELTIENIQLRAALYDLKNIVIRYSKIITDAVRRTDEFLDKKY